jgi:hypothetical protein
VSLTVDRRCLPGVTVLPYLEQGDPQAVAVLLLRGGGGGIVGLFRPPVAGGATDAPRIRDGSARPGDADTPADGYALVNFADAIEASWTRWAYSRLSWSGSRAVATSRNRSLYRCVIALTGSSSAHRSIRSHLGRKSLTWFPRYHHVPDWYIKDRIRNGVRVPAHVWMPALRDS